MEGIDISREHPADPVLTRSAGQSNGSVFQGEHQHMQETQTGHGAGPNTMTSSSDFEILCGPLLNYQRMSEEDSNVLWHGSVLIVTKPAQQTPLLELKPLGAWNPSHTNIRSSGRQTVEGLKLYSDPYKTFWRFTLRLPLAEAEAKWQYSIQNIRFLTKVSEHSSRQFVVPSVSESMRIMFHSCNGFSVGTDEDFWSGPVLWNDVLRVHQQRPFHVMIGGGDQIYNDSVRVSGPLKEWTSIGNPHKRREFPFSEQLRSECDKFYFDNYAKWYSTEPFASANAQIPQINIWDDHDIIDGFGSYTDNFMNCPVFRGIGGVSFKYYCLFQHHTAPPLSTFTTDAPSTMKAGMNGSAKPDQRQLKDTYVYNRTADDPSWIVGSRPGPYVEERSRSLYMRLGKRIAFCGIDARTERTRRQINYPETYDQIFNRLETEFKAAHGEIKHLILLLGVPIAYPRLAWLENILTSPIIAPIRLLNKRFGFAGGFFNKFDGSVDLLDDLDDHYTARSHKHERRELIVRLQKLSAEHSIRTTILSGDVHLGAVGRFYSTPADNMNPIEDPRYMANIVSSAITNKPPPKAVANLLARRNKIHHLRDGNTDETLMKMFDKQPGGVMKSAEWNRVTMPSRNYACITEVPDDDSYGHGPAANGVLDGNAIASTGRTGKARPQGGKIDGHNPLHAGEEGAGTQHPAADGISSEGPFVGGLNVSIRVEIDNQDREGKTEGYGMSIPKLVIASKEQASTLPHPQLDRTTA
ncbi:hypothetical protein LTR10_016108 [Elasticomyces elasticus]|uniref:PhoD-like phosphatase domain-containing protein n=1 Tax=Exophiala sideris TaxID=1016849 RepID=A0ABR0IW86_9EURO|nr:hypothetical protein LTR10_016108 [Elasticomyces elasticus]KAK5021523.1 hypothetical protein LTS07_010930 [Exophiala sideris]KAK5024557.1 hypothetical protein LTR13_010813 [Exophiala sideris]KAK5049658.1 hypothetical protein LTR69_010954 [Exophiala sideris]KAK5176639.1 hypothetical protein LTR44_010821 [Eurotiomycetes sp. CCFEE 6388]